MRYMVLCFFYKRSENVAVDLSPRTELMRCGWMKNVLHNDLNIGFRFLWMVSVAR